MISPYTKFARADGHTIWAHMDEWEGQQFNRAPGTLVSEVRRMHVDPRHEGTLRFTIARVLPEVQVPADNQYVKRVRIQSKILTQWWGHPMYLGATVLLPKGYDEHPDVHYPVIWEQGHFYAERTVRVHARHRDRITGGAPATHRAHNRTGIAERVPRRAG